MSCWFLSQRWWRRSAQLITSVKGNGQRLYGSLNKDESTAWLVLSRKAIHTFPLRAWRRINTKILPPTLPSLSIELGLDPCSKNLGPSNTSIWPSQNGKVLHFFLSHSPSVLSVVILTCFQTLFVTFYVEEKVALLTSKEELKIMQPASCQSCFQLLFSLVVVD